MGLDLFETAQKKNHDPLGVFQTRAKPTGVQDKIAVRPMAQKNIEGSDIGVDEMLRRNSHRRQERRKSLGLYERLFFTPCTKLVCDFPSTTVSDSTYSIILGAYCLVPVIPDVEISLSRRRPTPRVFYVTVKGKVLHR